MEADVSQAMVSIFNPTSCDNSINPAAQLSRAPEKHPSWRTWLPACLRRQHVWKLPCRSLWSSRQSWLEAAPTPASVRCGRLRAHRLLSPSPSATTLNTPLAKLREGLRSLWKPLPVRSGWPLVAEWPQPPTSLADRSHACPLPPANCEGPDLAPARIQSL